MAERMWKIGGNFFQDSSHLQKKCPLEIVGATRTKINKKKALLKKLA